MNEITVEMIVEPKFDVLSVIGGLARITQVRGEFKLMDHDKAKSLYEKLVDMGHTSLLECADFGFIIHGASRVFLSQITRHRLASFVSGSQQYQDHSGFEFVMPPEITVDDDKEAYEKFMQIADNLYGLFKERYGRDIARYLLPGAARVNALFIKANLREWLTTIFPQRICMRNTPEAEHVLRLILQCFVHKGYGELVEGYAAPACVTQGRCDQGSMCCGHPYKSTDEVLYGQG